MINCFILKLRLHKQEADNCCEEILDFGERGSGFHEGTTKLRLYLDKKLFILQTDHQPWYL